MPIFYGVQFIDKMPNGQPAQWTDLVVEAKCFRDNGTLKTGGISKAQHFKNVAKIMWGPKSKKHFMWHPWAEDMLEEACQNMWLWLSGCASCVAGHTRIPNPITGESPTIQELCESGTAPIVMTRNGPVVASVPFVKGVDDLYEVKLSNGQSFTATAAHLVQEFGSDAFVPVSSLLLGSRLVGYERVLPASISGTYPSTHGQDAHRSQKIAEGFRERCSTYPYRGGEPPLEEAGIDQSFSPSRGDVQERKGYVSFDGDVPAHTPPGIHPYQCSPHLSTLDTLGLLRLKGISAFHPHALETLSPEHQLFQPLLQSKREMPALNSFSKLNPCFSHKPMDRSELFSCQEYMVMPVVVQGISKTKKGVFYDLNVPIEHHYFADGCVHHNSGKTDFMAIWGIVNWMCSPQNTLVLFTSTSLKEARQRVWGSVLQYFCAYSDNKGKPILPGKIIDSVGMIRTTDGVNKYSDKCGLHLITGDKSKERENIGKLIGLKNKRVFLMGDELCELSPALVEAAKSNLISNPMFQMIGASNFKSIYDPFGSESEPIHGWTSVNPESTRWETKNGGVCLRFSGLKSPNIVEGHDKWKGIYDSQTLKRQTESFGRHSTMFWRMCESFPCPDADANRIYSDADFIRGLIHERVRWQSAPTKVAALDPAFATGGDKAIAYVGSYGMSTEGKWTLQYDKQVEIREDVRKKDESRSLQVAKAYRDLCTTEKVAPENAAYDASGGGLPFGALLGETWSLKLLGVQFGGAASERVVSVKDKRPAKDAYTNRVTELWFGGVDFIHSSQIKGVFKEAAEEWKERRYETIKGMTMRVKVERKEDMKLRINRSPDFGDSALILLELCRTRFNFVPEGMEGVRKLTTGSFKQRLMLVNRVYANVNYEPEEVAA